MTEDVIMVLDTDGTGFYKTVRLECDPLCAGALA